MSYQIVLHQLAPTDSRGRPLFTRWRERALIRFPEGDEHTVEIGHGWSLGLRRALHEFAEDRRLLWARLQMTWCRLAFWWAP